MTTAELIYEPRHYNRNAGCMIPAAWVAYVEQDGERLPKWPCGDTEDEARHVVANEFPGVRFV